MADYSGVTNQDLYDFIDKCIQEIDMMNVTNQDPVGTDVWESYLEALDEADRREK